MVAGHELNQGRAGVRARKALFVVAVPAVLAGYALFDRAFAWLHLPGIPVFAGELLLVMAIPFAALALRSRGVWRSSDAFFVAMVFVGWGFVRALPSVLDAPLLTYRDAVIWIYVIVGVGVLGALIREPSSLTSWLAGYRRLLPLLIVWLPLSGLADAMRSIPKVPFSDVNLLSHKPGNAAVHLIIAAAFCWTYLEVRTLDESKRRARMTFGVVIGALVLATQTRSGFVAIGVGAAVLLLFQRERMRLMIGLAGALMVVVVSVLVIDPQIPGGSRSLSTDQLAKNAGSIVTFEGEGAIGANIAWRLHHWGVVWGGVNSTAPLAGHGFGIDIADLYDIPQTTAGLRNPHNSHLGVLARMGWVGATLWLSMWAIWLAELVKARGRFLRSGAPRSAALAAWTVVSVVAILVNAIFDPTVEGPQVGLWLWSFFGLGIWLITMARPSRQAPAEELLVGSGVGGESVTA